MAQVEIRLVGDPDDVQRTVSALRGATALKIIKETPNYPSTKALNKMRRYVTVEFSSVPEGGM